MHSPCDGQSSSDETEVDEFSRCRDRIGDGSEYVHPALRAPLVKRGSGGLEACYPERGSRRRQAEIASGARDAGRHQFRGGRSRRRLKLQRDGRRDFAPAPDIREAPEDFGPLLRLGGGWLRFGRGRPEFPRAGVGAAEVGADVPGCDGRVWPVGSSVQHQQREGCSGRGHGRQVAQPPVFQGEYVFKRARSLWQLCCSTTLASERRGRGMPRVSGEP